MLRVLIGSPISQSPDILREFLISLTELEHDNNIEVSYCFVDDNSIKESKNILNEFKIIESERTTIVESNSTSIYYVDDYTHRWNNELVKKITEFKNYIIEIAIKEEYDYLFFIDSDIVLHPKTLKRLLSLDKEIVSNIFWTKWNPQTEELPQVWLKDAYTLYDFIANENITQGDVQVKTREFLDMLRKPGTYKVGGLGACTLISKTALLKGVNFNPVYNISFWGEDRHFCIRAAAYGIQLWVDTYYPAYHIYRTNDLKGVPNYKANLINRDTEILGSILSDKILAGLEGANTYSYKEDINKNFLKYFTKSKGESILEELNKNATNFKNNKIINKLKVMQCKLKFCNNNSLAISEVKYNENGYKNGYSYYKEAVGKCIIELVEGEWLITDWSFERKSVPDFIPLVRRVKEEDNKLTLSMIVKNEEHRYLRRCLESALEYIDNAVIIDDGSTDNTVGVIKDVLSGIPFTLIQNKESKFENEIDLRKQQWLETIATNPDWIVFLDADEIFEAKFKNNVRDMMKNIDVDGYVFRLYDFWDEDNFRNDKLWCAHYTYRLFMIRYQKNFRYIFTDKAQHCGRMPSNCINLPFEKSEVRLKHYGWAKEEDRKAKYERYMKLDPEGKFGSLAQYESILDTNPTLERWNEN